MHSPKPASVKEEAGKNEEATPSLEETYLQAGLAADDACFLANFSHGRRTRCIRKVSEMHAPLQLRHTPYT